MVKEIVFRASHIPDGLPEHIIVGLLTDQMGITLDTLKAKWCSQHNFPTGTALFTYATNASIEAVDIIDPETDEPEEYEGELPTVLNMTQIIIGGECKPGQFKLITVSPLHRMYPCDIDGDIVNSYDVDEILSGDPDLRGYWKYFQPEGVYHVRNKFLMPMPHYVFDRKSLSHMFNTIVASNDKALERIEDAMANGAVVGDFFITRDEEEFYICHIPSGTIVGWYKFYHYGRDNFTNRPDMKLEDLRDFFMLLRNQLLEEPDEPEEQTEYHPQVKVTETDHSTYEPTEADVEKAMRRITINSIYGSGIGLPSLEDIASMHPTVALSMEHVWNVVKQWASDKYNLSETNDVKCTVTNSHGKYYVAWLIRHYDFIQIMADNGEEIMIGYNRAEYSYANQYGRQTCVEDPDEQIRFDNQIIDRFYHDFFTHGPIRKEYDFYKKMAWEEDDNNAKDCDDR